MHNPCLGATPQSSLPWCNHTLPVSVRVADMLSRMTIAEKIAQLDTEAPAIASGAESRSYDLWVYHNFFCC